MDLHSGESILFEGHPSWRSTLAFYINGTKVRELRGQAPRDGWRFGISGDNFDKQKEATVLFTNMKVTD